LLPFNILNILPAMLVKVPVIKLAQAVGPFNNPLNRWAARFFFKRCHRIYARGRTTADYLESLALPPEKWQLSADIAFLYEAAYSVSHENENKVDTAEKILTDWQTAKHTIIGLAPSSLVYKEALKHDRDYVGHFIKLIDTMPEDTHYVLIPNATREGSDATFNNDLIVIKAILQAAPELAKTRVLAVDYDVNTASSRRLVALCDVLVTSRFHAMISSLSLGIPPVVVGWSHKYAEVLAAFDLESFALDFNQPNVDLALQVQQVLGNKAVIQAQLTANLHIVQALAAHQFNDVMGLLN
jgi:polysaccharide pyruvyl transferase WcaK-like protein